MTLPNDPFDFLWRNDDDATGRVRGEGVGPARSGRDVTGRDVSGRGSKPGEHFEPDLDAFFDDDLSADESELLYEHIRRERALAAEMFGTQRALDALRSTPRCPDFSQRILKQVDRKRGLLSGPWLKRLVIGRVAIAATLLLAMGGLYALHRASPEMATMGQPTPIGQLASAVPADAWRSQRSSDAGVSGWTAGLDLRGAAMDSRAALHAQSMLHAGPEARQVLVDAGETLPLGGDGVVFADPSSVAIVRPASQMAVEFPGLQGFAVVHDPSHERAFQAMLAEQSAVDWPRVEPRGVWSAARVVSASEPSASATVPAPATVDGPSRSAQASASRNTGVSRPAQPIVTDDCVYYMGRVMDRRLFQTVLGGFTAMSPLPFD